MIRRPRILVFDSGLGGLTVCSEILRVRPEGSFIYAADDAAFPYGRIYGPALLARVEEAMAWLLERHQADIVVIACNTASTLALPNLRARFPTLPFVGTVPAIKPAAASSVSGMISVLATPGTVQRDYTRDLIREHAAHCQVNLVGSTRLASIAEDFMRGEPVSDDEIAAEIAPCFLSKDGRRTDAIVLACTHYPLLQEKFERLAPWPAAWIDPAPAIARRVDFVLSERGFPPAGHGGASAEGLALFTSGRPVEGGLARVLAGRGLRPGDEGEALPYAAA